MLAADIPANPPPTTIDWSEKRRHRHRNAHQKKQASTSWRKIFREAFDPLIRWSELHCKIITTRMAWEEELGLNTHLTNAFFSHQTCEPNFKMSKPMKSPGLCMPTHAVASGCMALCDTACCCVALHTSACSCMPLQSVASRCKMLHVVARRCTPVHVDACRLSVFESCSERLMLRWEKQPTMALGTCTTLVLSLPKDGQ